MTASRTQLEPVLTRWEQGDFSRWDAVFAPDMLLTGFNGDGHGEARGPAGIDAYLRGFFEQFSGYRIEVGGFEQLADDALIMSGRQFATGRGSGIEIAETLFIVFRFDGGKLAEMHWHPKREGALQAAGLGAE